MDQEKEIVIESLENESISQEPNKKKRLCLILMFLLLLLTGVGLTLSLLGDRLKELTVDENEVIELLPSEDEEVSEGNKETLSSPESDASGSNDGDGAGESQVTDVRDAGVKKKTLHAEMITEDNKRVWSTMTQVDIFDDFYTGTYKAGTHDEVTVESDDGAKVIAPGTDGYYTFWIKNTGQVPMDYQVSFESKQNYDYDIPMEFRLKSGDMYIFGDGHNWMSWEELNKAGEGKRLEPKNYARYTLEWRWKFRGDNKHDTYLGNKAVHQDVKQIVIIYTTGTVSQGYSEAMLLGSVQTGDTTSIWPYMLLILLAMCGIVGYLWRKKRNDEEEDAE